MITYAKMDVNVNRLARLQPSSKKCQKKKPIDLVQNKEIQKFEEKVYKIYDFSTLRRLKRHNEQ